jgi:zinc transport system ATP-binding protein
MSIIDVQNLSVSFGGDSVINDISFTVEEGDIAMILGPNGSGKSTLLRALLALTAHTGTVRIDGQKVSQVLSSIGYVPQRFDFDRTFPITVHEFLSLVSRDEAKIDKSLKEVDMRGYKNHLLGKLSGGELQRVLIARAIVDVPRILILDEPTSGIDAEGIKQFFAILEHMNTRHGVTILMVSHEINIVYDIATKVICLNKDLVCLGSPKEVLTTDALTELYGSRVQHHAHSYND